ncbi:MAG: NAD(P)H-dependent glycerol-3-phosphate dehydrogenase, partial [Chloroflexota bacterium]
EQHTNSRYLPGVTLQQELDASSDIVEVLAQSQVLFVAIPSVFIESTLQPVQQHLNPDTIVVNMAKGIDGHSGLTSYQTIAALFPNNPKVMLSGPSIANEFARGMPTIVVLASEDGQGLMAVAHLLDNVCFRTRFSDDVVGVELGGVLKNIYAIGLGIFDGKDIQSVNFRSVYLTIALEEIARLGVAMGAKIETFLYLSGIGDLLATSLSEHSHNRSLGERLASGRSLEEIRREMGVLPEGYNTLEVALYIAEKLHVSIPLAKGLWDVLHGRYEADRFITAFVSDFVER